MQDKSSDVGEVRGELARGGGVEGWRDGLRRGEREGGGQGRQGLRFVTLKANAGKRLVSSSGPRSRRAVVVAVIMVVAEAVVGTPITAITTSSILAQIHY